MDSKLEDAAIAFFAIAIIAGFFVFFVGLIGGIRIEASEQNVSGVVYNTSNNSFIGGNTRFSVRASEDTYVSEENRSSYCLPPNSPYIALVNEAAKDKNIRVNVETKKAFTWVLPWKCIDNVTVTKVE